LNRRNRSTIDEESALTMFPNVGIGALALGALLVLAAVLAPRLRGTGQRGSTATWRVAAAVAGVVLLGWGVIASLRPPASPPAPAAAAPRAAPEVDLVEAASAALQSCPHTTAPTIPDGTTASREEMGAATAAFKSFDAATNSYAQCVDATIERIAREHAGASEDDLHALKEFGRVAHNTAIDQETAIADQLNAQVRSYKAKHPQT
jgi:hypothetical protein